MKYNFKKIYWGTNKHTSVLFQSFDNIPENLHPTACMVFATNETGLLMVKSDRGWGLPGGHIEEGETPEQCAVREVYEEAYVKIESLKLVGGWVTKKEFHTDDNKKYPNYGVMLLYTAMPKTIETFKAAFETSERKFVKFNEIKKLHDGRSDFYEVSRFIMNEKI